MFVSANTSKKTMVMPFRLFDLDLEVVGALGLVARCGRQSTAMLIRRG